MVHCASAERQNLIKQKHYLFRDKNSFHRSYFPTKHSPGLFDDIWGNKIDAVPIINALVCYFRKKQQIYTWRTSVYR